ncbi:hypothetical protein RUM43_010988 [Polyplax serrata]|uniref:Sine oculis-binding protein homolog n=1 Tax=Polyplax serrata TaxID=468196 RepID=A0AAN8P4C7_POLSC
MNELLGWYGYDKVDSRDTQGLNLHHFSSSKMASVRRSPSEADSSDAEGTRNSGSPGRKDVPPRRSPTLPDPPATPAGCIICSWCNKIVSHKMFSMKTPVGEKSFCSEMCFSQCRRANFKRNKTCDWCRHIRHTVNYVDFQDGEHQLQFCSDKCLNQYKMNIFCKETEAHLQLHPHLQGLGSTGNGKGNASVRLITPELWLRDCRSESPLSDRSVSPSENNSTPIEIKVVMRPPNETPQTAVKPPPSLEITKVDRKGHHRERPRKGSFLDKNKKQARCIPGNCERRGSSSSPRSGVNLLLPKPGVFPPPLLPINGNPVPHLPPHVAPTSEHGLLRPPFMPLGCYSPSHTDIPNPSRHPQILRPPVISPTSPSAQTVINKPPINQILPPPRSLLPPVTVLVPYPVALAIPIPLPIPIPIPLNLLKKKDGSKVAPEDDEEDEGAKTPQTLVTPEETPTASIPRPLRKRKRVPETPQEDESASQRKTVPV